MRRFFFSAPAGPLRTACWFGAASLFLTLAVLFTLAAGRAEEKARLLRGRSDAAAAFAASPSPPPSNPFVYPARDFRTIPETLRAAGLSVETVSEEPPEASGSGEILKMKVAGSGNFFQVISLFDIIHMKKHWVSADLLRMERAGDRLSFEVALCAYRSRGTYEEEKHRTDRSDGHGEEPRREDSR